MASFTVNLSTDNAAFEDGLGHEVARILREVAGKVEEGSTSGKVFDYNGNSVGTFSTED